MPFFSITKEMAIGTAVLGVAFATGVLAGKKYPFLAFGIPRSSKTLLGKGGPLWQYILDHSLREHPVLKKLRLLTLDHPWGRMMVSCDQAQLMANLAKLIKAKKAIEIGVFTGYNTLNMALVLPDDGKVVACDINEDYVSIGKPLWKEAGVEHKIDLRIKPAIQTLGKQSLLRGVKDAEGIEKLVYKHQRQEISDLGKCSLVFVVRRKQSLPRPRKRQMQNKFV
ncbi:catechol O-methyltransferase domain-containing protein 1 isoform X2 [Malaclemys terrapin pileata]|uniref:catechol O-methyltransferase domain-containing protein 1 isoform X2 n=1 Tax=Malaclemys terrapin pileata TaxID=2991368 RepID=UPI0023A8ED09|nr:catechol O-methyltransferase domain-containing protein 1 isoform X2 [Malaclemys terrapin pileata]